jgi:hypothetical protein
MNTQNNVPRITQNNFPNHTKMSICTISGVKVCTVFGIYSIFLSEERALSDVHPGTISGLIAYTRVATAGVRGTYSPDASRQTKCKKVRQIICKLTMHLREEEKRGRLALQNLDGDMPQYITDNTDDELSHAAFLNAYLVSHGAEPVNLDAFSNFARQ